MRDYRGTLAVPLVLYPADGALPPAPRLGPRPRAAVAAAAAALNGLAADLERRTSRQDGWLDRGLARATAATEAAVEALAPWLPDVATTAAEPHEPHDIYMGVRRADLAPSWMAAEAAVMIQRSLADLAHAPLDLNEVIAEARASAAILARIAADPADPGDPTDPAAPGAPGGGAGRRGADRWGAGGAGTDRQGTDRRDTDRQGVDRWGSGGQGADRYRAADRRPDPTDRDGRAAYRPSGDGLERWVLVHHLYGLLHLHTADRLDAAAAALAAGDPDAAAAALRQATGYLRGTTATMFHAAALPATYYKEVVRPTMAPPATPFNLGGSMNAENTATRKALARVLEHCPEPFAALARRHLPLALARDELLAVDLLDIERHVALAAVMVGDDHSLLQPDTAADNAAGVLRRIRHERAVRYGPMMRFGDRAVARGADRRA